MSGPLRHPQAFQGADAVPLSEAARIRSEIGETVRSIRMMLDRGDLPEPLSPAFPTISDQPPNGVAGLWTGLRARFAAGLLSPMRTAPIPETRIGEAVSEPSSEPAPGPVPEPPAAPIILQPPADSPDPAAVVVAVLQDPALAAQLRDQVRAELEGEMGQRFSANLRALVRREIALAEERGLIG